MFFQTAPGVDLETDRRPGIGAAVGESEGTSVGCWVGSVVLSVRFPHKHRVAG